MHTIKQLQRLEKIHQFITEEKTGTPLHLAQIMGISRSTVFELISYLKLLDAPIKYSRVRETYYYIQPFNLEINVSIKVLSNDEVKDISGGAAIIFSKFPSIK